MGDFYIKGRDFPRRSKIGLSCLDANHYLNFISNDNSWICPNPAFYYGIKDSWANFCGGNINGDYWGINYAKEAKKRRDSIYRIKEGTTIYDIRLKNEDKIFIKLRDYPKRRESKSNFERIFVVLDRQDLIVMMQEFGLDKEEDDHKCDIDWGKVSKSIGGIEVYNYFYLRDLQDNEEDVLGTWIYKLDANQGIIYNINLLESITDIRPVMNVKEKKKLKFDIDVNIAKRVLLLEDTCITTLPKVIEYRMVSKFNSVVAEGIIPHSVEIKPDRYVTISNFDKKKNYRDYVLYINDTYDFNKVKKVFDIDFMFKGNEDKLTETLTKLFCKVFGGIEMNNGVGIIWNLNVIKSITPLSNGKVVELDSIALKSKDKHLFNNVNQSGILYFYYNERDFKIKTKTVSKSSIKLLEVDDKPP